MDRVRQTTLTDADRERRSPTSVIADIVTNMEWIATGIAVLASLFAGWQAWEARRSRKDAEVSASNALDHEERAVAASERMAAAVEEQNERARTRARSTSIRGV